MLRFLSKVPSSRLKIFLTDVCNCSQCDKSDKVNFFVSGHPVCLSSFCYVHGLKEGRLHTLIKHYKENGAVPRHFQYKGRNHQAITWDEAEKIVKFLNNVATIHALAIPGRVPGE